MRVVPERDQGAGATRRLRKRRGPSPPCANHKSRAQPEGELDSLEPRCGNAAIQVVLGRTGSRQWRREGISRRHFFARRLLGLAKTAHSTIFRCNRCCQVFRRLTLNRNNSPVSVGAVVVGSFGFGSEGFMYRTLPASIVLASVVIASLLTFPTSRIEIHSRDVLFIAAVIVASRYAGATAGLSTALLFGSRF